jgi:hypothetical protein
MKKLYKPWVILLSLSLPQLIMMGVMGRIFWFLHTELTDRQLTHWTLFAAPLGAFCAGITLYGLLSWFYQKELHILAAYLIFIFYFGFLIAYLFLHGEMISGQLPDYMLMGISPAITILTLTMPALVYSALLIVEHIVERYQLKSIVKPILLMLAIPLFWYFSITLVDVGNRGISNLLDRIVPIVFIGSSAAFLFLFLTVLYIVLKRKSALLYQYMGIIVLIGSLMGLGLNQSLGNILGNFSHWGFYVCNSLTTGILLIPPFAHQRWRLVVFIIKGCLLWYSVYFFIVFLPYMPLALPGSIALGLGLLLLMPALLLFVHLQSLKIDCAYLKAYYTQKRLMGIWIIQILALPMLIGMTVRQDQMILNQALRYTYQRSYTDQTQPQINTAGLKRALGTIKDINNNNRRGNSLFAITTHTPYLTAFYHVYVLDNLSLSSDKIKTLENIFLGMEEQEPSPTAPQGNADVRVSQAKSETIYDADQKLYRSWIHFDLKNQQQGLGEFYTVFKIPEGSYISDYYLYVGSEKKHGIIADKRAANWIYQQNKVINRDPGVLTYLSGNEIEFKIFPFEAKQMRKTGLEIVHRTPIDLSIAGQDFLLHTAASPQGLEVLQPAAISPQVHYVTSEMKEGLPKVTRKPKYYFIIDSSQGSNGYTEAYIQRVKTFIKTQGIAEDIGEIIGVNFKENRVPYQEGWEEAIQKTKLKGGFYPDYTIKRILYEHYSNHLEEQPIFIVVTNDLKKAVFSKDFGERDFMNPEGMKYYHLMSEERLTEHTLETALQGINHHTIKFDEMSPSAVCLYKTDKGISFYLPDDGQDSIVLLDSSYEMTEDEMKASAWSNGVLLEAMYRSYLLHPEQYFEKSLAIVKGSIVSRVMSPLTSFIVLENKAQEKVMLEKQKQLLASPKSLDIGEMTEMSEPPLVAMLCLAGFLTYANRKRFGTKNNG